MPGLRVRCGCSVPFEPDGNPKEACLLSFEPPNGPKTKLNHCCQCAWQQHVDWCGWVGRWTLLSPLTVAPLALYFQQKTRLLLALHTCTQFHDSALMTQALHDSMKPAGRRRLDCDAARWWASAGYGQRTRPAGPTSCQACPALRSSPSTVSRPPHQIQHMFLGAANACLARCTLAI